MEENKKLNLEEENQTVEEITDEKVDKEIDEKFSYQYKINPEYTGFALTRYFKNFVYKRNWAYTIIFFIILALYIVEIIRNVNNTIAWILAGVCLALISWLWLKIGSFKKKTIAAAEVTKEDLYECKVFDDSLSIKIIDAVINEETGERLEDVTPNKINFMSDFTNVENHENMFLIFVNKEMTFIISKDGMDKSLNDEFVKFFKANCGENYTDFVCNSEIKD